MDNTTHQVRLAQWIEIVEACNRRLEGMTAKQWLLKKHIITGSVESGRKF